MELLRGTGLRRMLAVVVAGAALAGCGGSELRDLSGPGEEDRESTAGSTTTTTGPESAETKAAREALSRATSTTVGGGKAATGGGAGADGKPGAKASEVDTTTLTMEISAELKETCVRPGGLQTITVHAPHTSAVGYDTYYSDGKSGLHEGFHGGNMVGWTDETDSWSHTWTVAATAPPGRAVVVVMAIHNEKGRGETGAIFAVADPLGLCDPPRYDEVIEE